MGIYEDYTNIRGIRMHDSAKYYYQTETNHILSKEERLQALNFYNSSPLKSTLKVEIYIEVSTTYGQGPSTSYMWFPIQNINKII